ncbi:MAG TPA: hypothetical protein VFW40_05250 [Capsulimonadaceae bacterium]|nr:hypothetical protein [Capsulimonadaceae bacterium]
MPVHYETIVIHLPAWERIVDILLTAGVILFVLLWALRPRRQ